MDFSTQDVERIAADVERLTEGAFTLQAIGGDLGRGVRYIDGREQLVWLGKRGAAECVAYYAHGCLAYAERNDLEIPAHVRAAAEATSVDPRPSVGHWADRGSNVGEFRWRIRHDPMHNGTGA